MKKLGFKHTVYACYVGYITQAIVNNFAPLLFLTFQSEFGISLDKIALLVTLNFGTQIIVDYVAGKFADRIGYRRSMYLAHIFSAVGLAGLAIFPSILPNAFLGILLAVIIYAIGGGLLEVLVSPVVEACPNDNKAGAMSLLHSFYCWGHMAVVILSTLFFITFGISHWRIMALIWALVPALNILYFSMVPIGSLIEDGEKGMSIRELLKSGAFWVLALLMVCAGSCEQGISQWASAFAEMGLGVSKTVGDLAGPTCFALLMGIARAFYGKFSEKIQVEKFMLISAVLCLISYLMASLSPSPLVGLIGCGLCGLSVGILWPGTFSISTRVLKNGGTAMFALLALFGDVGCGGGPGFVGLMSGFFDGSLNIGLLFGTIFPILLLIGLFLLYKLPKKSS